MPQPDKLRRCATQQYASESRRPFLEPLPSTRAGGPTKISRATQALRPRPRIGPVVSETNWIADKQLFARKASRAPTRGSCKGATARRGDASEPPGPLQFGCRTRTRRRRRASPARAGLCCPSFPMQARSCSLISPWGSFPVLTAGEFPA